MKLIRMYPTLTGRVVVMEIVVTDFDNTTLKFKIFNAQACFGDCHSDSYYKI